MASDLFENFDSPDEQEAKTLTETVKGIVVAEDSPSDYLGAVISVAVDLLILENFPSDQHLDIINGYEDSTPRKGLFSTVDQATREYLAIKAAEAICTGKVNYKFAANHLATLISKYEKYKQDTAIVESFVNSNPLDRSPRKKSPYDGAL